MLEDLCDPRPKPDEEALAKDAYSFALSLLTPQEREIAERMMAGESHEAIARRLSCARVSVGRKIKSIRMKLLKLWKGWEGE